MAKKKFVVGCFDDEDLLFPAVKKVRTVGYKIHDIYTPFPVHGLDHAMGLRETSLHTAGFIYGITGTTTALSCISWILTKDWPLNIGGKPHFALPAWIPITFELTVLFAAVGMVLTFIALFMISFAREKHEDEYVSIVRLQALQISVYANYMILGLSSLAMFGSIFLVVMQINLFTILILFILIYQYKLNIKPRFSKN